MRKKLTCVSLVLALLLALALPTGVSAADSKDLTIYALYLTSSTELKGDCTLLSSDGHCLLIDIGRAEQVPSLITKLQELSITHVDILFSHLHIDHTGGSKDSTNYASGLQQIANAGITIDTLYMPDKSLASKSVSYPARYAAFEAFMATQSGQIVYLKMGDTLAFGDVSAEVIGPVNPDALSPAQYTTLTEENRYVRYENNCSLALIFTCGSTRFFTAGDSYGDEADQLVAQYGSALDCDIMKLNHHGIGSGNTEELLAAISPSYSYITNTTLSGKQENGKWRAYKAVSRASEYGLCYMLGNEKETIIYRIKDNDITLYRGNTLTKSKKMTGWIYLYGADGFNRDHDLYYLNKSCTPLTGVRELDGHYFYFRSGGQMDYGTYNKNGQYSGWRSYDGKTRYFTLSSSEKYAYMSLGVAKVGGNTYYFDDSGFVVLPEESDSNEELPTKIGSSYYLIDFSGILSTDCWETYDDELYYFNTSGKMLEDGVYKVDGDYYIFEANGAMVAGDGQTELYKFNGNTYAVRTDGTLVTGKRAKIDDKTYYFNSTGVMQKNKIITINKKSYYFGKNGQMAVNKKVKVKGKVYYAKKSGVLKTTK